MQPGWTRQTVAGIPVDVFAPPTVRGVVIYLHPVGGEMPADNAAYTAAFAEHSLAVVAPHGGPCWWVDKPYRAFSKQFTPERFLVEHLLPWLRGVYPGHRNVAAAGVSMGGQGAVRLGFKYPKSFPVVASVAGAFDFHDWHGRGRPLDDVYPSKEAARQDTAVLMLNPTAYPPHLWFVCDPADAEWYRGNDRLHEKLSAYGVPHECDLDTAAGGHTWAYFDAMAGRLAAFVADGLDKESRRLM